ncbi:MAG: zinc chelation protein SecC [Bdellovibrio sp. CG10_big_fil_rev_8_21_14_0_10_47_8]|nr:MAG: zinc chelation protein SecC [Bdellovibrio sp. CG10_big_fil_rev_8_21_14_0_10_47_8]
MSLCPCGSGTEFNKCCEPFLKEEELPPTPEALMRSRYTAYCLKNHDYLVETTDPQIRSEVNHTANREWAEAVEFTGLEILASSAEKNKGMVEFRAKFKDAEGQDQEHHELSKFRKQAGVWYFRDGQVKDAKK